MHSSSRKCWSEKEDQAIISVVEQIGDKDWRGVAQRLEKIHKIRGRTGK